MTDPFTSPPSNHVLCSTATQENLMAKGQQKSNKEGKKPKKDGAPPKPISPGAVMPTVTTVVPDRSKKK